MDASPSPHFTHEKTKTQGRDICHPFFLWDLGQLALHLSLQPRLATATVCPAPF